MIFKQYLEPQYDSFRKGPQTSGGMNSNTLVDLDSTGFGTLCLYVDRIHTVAVKVDGQSVIMYPSS
jgi:hypothetical protein